MQGALRTTVVRSLVACAAGCTTLGISNVGAVKFVASADPASVTALAGVGSDTTQDVFDAFAGVDPYPTSGGPGSPAYYTPLSAGTTSASTDVTVQSWDAIPAGGSSTAPGCISTKYGGPSFDRPNGSGNGTTALYDAVTNAAWVAPSYSCTTTPVSVTGQIDFARSVKGPKTTGTTLTWIPFDRDAVGVAYFDHSTGHLASLTTAELTQIYTNGSATVGGDTVLACLPPAGSAVRSNFESAISVSDTVANAGALANGCNSTIEQNGGNTFYSFASAEPAGTDVVIPFSAASWISQANGAALDRSATGRANGVNLAAIDSLGVPYTGTAPNEVSNTTYYQNGSYGVTAYVVAPTSKVSGLFASASYKGLFVGATSAICSANAQATAAKYGFDPIVAGEGTCGSTTQQGNG